MSHLLFFGKSKTKFGPIRIYAEVPERYEGIEISWIIFNLFGPVRISLGVMLFGG